MWQDLTSMEPLAQSDTLDVASVAAASAAIRDLCGWHIAPVRTQTFVVDEPLGRPDVFLPTLRLVEITGVSVLGVALTADELAALDWSSQGYLSRGPGCRWPTRRRSVLITARHGYDRTPANVAQVCLALAGRVASTPAGLARRQVGQRSEEYLRGIHESELATLAPYRIPPGA